MSSKPIEYFDSIQGLQDAARTARSQGYVVLVAEARCGHWIGYSIFMADGTDEGKLLCFTNKADFKNADPKAIYYDLN